MKAIAANSVSPLKRRSRRYNAKTGFGQLNVGKYLHFEDDSNAIIINDFIKILYDDHLVKNSNVLHKTRELRMAIAFNDFAKNSDSQIAMIIDIDLVAISPKKDYYSWKP